MELLNQSRSLSVAAKQNEKSGNWLRIQGWESYTRGQSDKDQLVSGLLISIEWSEVSSQSWRKPDIILDQANSSALSLSIQRLFRPLRHFKLTCFELIIKVSDYWGSDLVHQGIWLLFHAMFNTYPNVEWRSALSK